MAVITRSSRSPIGRSTPAPSANEPIALIGMESHAEPDPSGGLVERCHRAAVDDAVGIGGGQLGRRLAHLHKTTSIGLIELGSGRDESVAHQPPRQPIGSCELDATARRVDSIHERSNDSELNGHAWFTHEPSLSTVARIRVRALSPGIPRVRRKSRALGLARRKSTAVHCRSGSDSAPYAELKARSRPMPRPPP
jgi:hypothetical protein